MFDMVSVHRYMMNGSVYLIYLPSLGFTKFFLLPVVFQYFTSFFIGFDVSSDHFVYSPEPHILLALFHPSPHLIIFRFIRKSFCNGGNVSMNMIVS